MFTTPGRTQKSFRTSLPFPDFPPILCTFLWSLKWQPLGSPDASKASIGMPDLWARYPTHLPPNLRGVAATVDWTLHFTEVSFSVIPCARPARNRDGEAAVQGGHLNFF